jgi:hypothetical protein
MLLKRLWEVIQCAIVWGAFILMCDLGGWYWFQDWLKAADWRIGIMSGPGVAPVWLCGFILPVVILFALLRDRRSDER